MSGEFKELGKEAAQRVADCRQQKSHVDTDLREGYFFTAPRRSRDVSSQSMQAQPSRQKDQGELQTSLGMEVAQDFATEILNSFMPETLPWARQKAGVDIEEGDAEEVNELIGQQTGVIFDAIKASNFYSCAAQSFMPDLALGTSAMWVEDKKAHEPVSCLPVPMRELDINIGPDGTVDDRFITRWTRYRHLRALLGEIELPGAIEDKIKKQGNTRCAVSWGWWHDWSNTGDVDWQAVIRVGQDVVAADKLRGEGSCPLLVMRFNPDTMFAFGDGPTLQSLPELRRLDEMEALDIEGYDFRVHKPFFYADDGVINLENGVEPGMGYAARPWGTSAPFIPMDFGGTGGLEEYKLNKVESRIRRLHFVDYPEQVGKTPPTAEQWMDEQQRTRRRIGTPGKTFWKEGPREVFLRFKFLLEKRGTIEPITVDGRTISLTPYDPTEQAQEFQEVQLAGRVLEMARTYLPQTAELLIDGEKTIKNIKTKLGDKVVELRDPEQIKQAVQQFAPVLGGAGGMPPGGAGA